MFGRETFIVRVADGAMAPRGRATTSGSIPTSPRPTGAWSRCAIPGATGRPWCGSSSSATGAGPCARSTGAAPSAASTPATRSTFAASWCSWATRSEHISAPSAGGEAGSAERHAQGSGSDLATVTRASARRAVRRSGSTRYATASSPSPTAGRLPTSLTKRLVNHARPQDVTQRLRRRLDDGAASRERPARRRSNRRADWRSNADFRDLAIDRLTCAGW